MSGQVVKGAVEVASHPSQIIKIMKSLLEEASLSGDDVARFASVIDDATPAIQDAFRKGDINRWIAQAKKGDFGDEVKGLMDTPGMAKGLKETATLLTNENKFLKQFIKRYSKDPDVSVDILRAAHRLPADDPLVEAIKSAQRDGIPADKVKVLLDIIEGTDDEVAHAAKDAVRAAAKDTDEVATAAEAEAEATAKGAEGAPAKEAGAGGKKGAGTGDTEGAAKEAAQSVDEAAIAAIRGDIEKVNSQLKQKVAEDIKIIDRLGQEIDEVSKDMAENPGKYTAKEVKFWEGFSLVHGGAPGKNDVDALRRHINDSVVFQKNISEDNELFQRAVRINDVASRLTASEELSFWKGFVDAYSKDPDSLDVGKLARTFGLKSDSDIVETAREFRKEHKAIPREALIDNSAEQAAKAAGVFSDREHQFWLDFVYRQSIYNKNPVAKNSFDIDDLIEDWMVDSDGDLTKLARRIHENKIRLSKSVQSNPENILDKGVSEVRELLKSPDAELADSMDKLAASGSGKGAGVSAAGKAVKGGVGGEHIIPDAKETIFHKALKLHWAHFVPGFGNPHLGLPNIMAGRIYIRPAVKYVDDILGGEGNIAESVMELRQHLYNVTHAVREGKKDLAGAQSSINRIFVKFAENNGEKIQEALEKIEVLKEELNNPERFIAERYSGLTGLRKTQLQSLKEYVRDVEETLKGLAEKDPSSYKSLASRYSSKLQKIAQQGDTSLSDAADSLDTMLDSRLDRVGKNVNTRLTGLVDGKPAQIREKRGLEWTIEASAYNRYDRLDKVLMPGEANPENRLILLLQDYERFPAGAKDAYASVEDGNTFMSMLSSLYDAGDDYNAMRVMRILNARRGAASRMTFPDGVKERIRVAYVASNDPYRQNFGRKLLAAIDDLRDDDIRYGYRFTEAKYYAPFADFMLQGRAYGMEKYKGWSKPAWNNFVVAPMHNSYRNVFAYLTGGRTVSVSPAEGHVADHIKKITYDHLFLPPKDENGRRLKNLFSKDAPAIFKAPVRVLSGGMLSFERGNIPLSTWGRFNAGLAASTYAVDGITSQFYGDELDGWDGKPGWNIGYDPRRAIGISLGTGLTLVDGITDYAIPTAGNLLTGWKYDFQGLDMDNLNLPWSDKPVDLKAMAFNFGKETDKELLDKLNKQLNDIGSKIRGNIASISSTTVATSELGVLVNKATNEAIDNKEKEKADKLTKLMDRLTPQMVANKGMSEVARGINEDYILLQQEIMTGDIDVARAEEILELMKDYETKLKDISEKAEELNKDFRAEISKVPEAAILLTAATAQTTVGNAATVASPASVAAGTVAGGNTQQAAPAGSAGNVSGGSQAQNQGAVKPLIIGKGAKSGTASVTPLQEKLDEIKNEAARILRDSNSSVEQARLAAEQANEHVEQILKAQERLRENGRDPTFWDGALHDVKLKAQEAEIAYRTAVDANKDAIEILPQIKSATVADLDSAKVKLSQMQDQVDLVRKAQRQAAKAAVEAGEVIDKNKDLSDFIFDMKQEERIGNITRTIDGGDNGLASGLLRTTDGVPGVLSDWFNSASDAVSGIRDWWQHDVARAASKSKGGKTLYEAANVGFTAIGALMAISLWNSTLGKLSGTQIGGTVKLLIVGAVLLYALRGTSKTGDRLDKLAGRYRATGQNYDPKGTTGGAYPFRSGTVSVQRMNGHVQEVGIPGKGKGRVIGHDSNKVFEKALDDARREANMQGNGGHLPEETGETYHRAITIKNSDGQELGTGVIDFTVPAANEEEYNMTSGAVAH